jgi:hypothetical protein
LVVGSGSGRVLARALLVGAFSALALSALALEMD